uniref:aldehyde dehydrogenase family protein n=1 Tax=Bacillus mycoides TaxID=1405 RepID=UPI0011AA5BE8
PHPPTLLLHPPTVNQQPPQPYFLPPTIFHPVNHHIKISQHQIFPPLLTILRLKHLQQAINLTNQSKFPNPPLIYTS